MTSQLHTFKLNLNFRILGFLSEIDRFGGEWTGIERREGAQTLRQLKSIATVHSVGASTRIEGSKMTDDEVREFIFNQIRIEKLVERDQQEVKGYFNALDIIAQSYQDIDITENSLKNLHNQLMLYSDKDQWHKGKYKVNPNLVEATHVDGSKTIVFETTPPGIETENSMRMLMEWYNSDKDTPPIIKTAAFVYDFLSIHPFQDGNGRLSRLLGTLLLLKNGYPWIQYISFEHEIENRKVEYYQTLMNCQHNRPREDITQWLAFFLDCMSNLQHNLRKKLDTQRSESQMQPREKMIYTFIENHPGCKSGEIAEKLNIPLPSVKKMLGEMVNEKLLEKYGLGPGTNYTTRKVTIIKTDVAHTFSNEIRRKEFVLKNKYAFVTIKKILLTPKFQWKTPNDWSHILLNQHLELMVACFNSKEGERSQPYFIGSYVTPYHATPEFTLNHPIHIPLSIWNPYDNEFPIRVVIELNSNNKPLEFDVTIVYDADID